MKLEYSKVQRKDGVSFYRKKRSSTQNSNINFRVSAELQKKLDNISKKTKLSKSTILRNAIYKYIEFLESEIK